MKFFVFDINMLTLRISFNKCEPKHWQHARSEDTSFQTFQSLSVPPKRINDFYDIILHFSFSSTFLPNQKLPRILCLFPLMAIFKGQEVPP